MDYEKLIKIRNATNYFANMMDLRIVEIKKGYARTVIDPVTKTHLNPINSIHGGCLFTIGDVTAGSAASSYGIQVTTLDSHFNFLRPGLHTTKLTGEATELKHGKTFLSIRYRLRIRMLPFWRKAPLPLLLWASRSFLKINSPL